MPMFAISRFRPLLHLASWYLLLGAVLRCALWWTFGRTGGVSLHEASLSILAGVPADAAQSLYLLAPFALLLALMPDRWVRTAAFARIARVGVFVWLYALTFIAFAEYFFFEEFDARFNLVSVDYLLYPTEVVGDIRAEYPVGTIVIGVFVVTALTMWMTRKRWFSGAARPTRLVSRARVAAIYAAAVAIALFTVDTDSNAFSGNRITNEIAANGASSFFRALRTSEIDYHAYYATRDSRANLRILRAQLASSGHFAQHDSARLNREFAARPGLGRLNVVVIASESFGAEFSRLYGSERDWTPKFDRLAQQGMWFSHMYASGTRTVRGLEAIATSLPPIPTASILHRPGNERIANWGTVMRKLGYETSFLYGGYGYFDNMNYFFAQNGFDVFDRTSISQPVRFENMWGVADEDLYDFALQKFDAQAQARKPFFSIIMNTSNHKPFTFRNGVPGVKPEGGGRESGVRYADFAQAYFLSEAKKHAWFDDTLFVIVADHGARVYGREEIPLSTYEIPMLFYSPKHVAPRRIDTLTTQIDIAPTVLGLLGLPYTAPFFGQDALNTPEEDRVAFFSHNHDVALYRGGRLSILGMKKSVTNVLYDRRTNSYRTVANDPQLDGLAIAYYQTAYELFRNHEYEIPSADPVRVASRSVTPHAP